LSWAKQNGESTPNSSINETIDLFILSSERTRN